MSKKVKKIFRSKSNKGQKETEWGTEDDEILTAIEKNDAQKLKQLLTKKNACATKIDVKGHTALHRAAMQGSVDIMNTLLSNDRVDISAIDAQGRIPLHDACRMGHREVAELLLQHMPASKNAVDNFSSTPLHMACMYGKRSCVELLLRHDVNVDPVDNNECTPLFYAAKLGHLDICKALVNKRANYNARDAKRKSPLIVATENNKPEICDYLISRGADVYLRDSSGHDALQYASEKKYEPIVRSIQQASAMAGAGQNLDDEREKSDSNPASMYEEIGGHLKRKKSKDSDSSSSKSSKSSRSNKKKLDEVDSGLVPMNDMRKFDQDRKFSDASDSAGGGGRAEYLDLNGYESGDIVPYDEAVRMDIENVIGAARQDSDDERPLVALVSNDADGAVEAAVYAGLNESAPNENHIGANQYNYSDEVEYDELEEKIVQTNVTRATDVQVILPDADLWEPVERRQSVGQEISPPRKLKRSQSTTSSSSLSENEKPRLVSAKLVDDDESVDEDVIVLQRASPKNPDIIVEWLDKSDNEPQYAMPYEPYQEVVAEKTPELQQERNFDIPWPKDSSSSKSSSRRSSQASDKNVSPPVLRPPKEFEQPAASTETTEVAEIESKLVMSTPSNVDNDDGEILRRRVNLLESELAANRQSLSAMEMDEIQKYRALQDSHDQEVAKLHEQIDRLETKNASLEKLLADEKRKQKRGDSDSSSSDSDSNHSDNDGRKPKRIKAKELEKLAEKQRNEIRELEEEIEKLHKENHFLNEKISVDARIVAENEKLSDELTKLDEENKELIEKMALLSNALASQSDSHNNNREIEKLLKQIADLEEEKRQDAHELEARSAEADKLRESVEVMEKKEEDMQKIIAQLENDKRKLAKEADEARLGSDELINAAVDMETKALLEEIERLNQEKDYINEQLLKSSNDGERDRAELILLRQKLGDRDESLIQNELEDTKAKLKETTTTKDELYEQLSDVQMSVMDLRSHNERLEQQIAALEKILQTTVKEKEELQQTVRDIEDEKDQLKHKIKLSKGDSSSSDSDNEYASEMKKIHKKVERDLQERIRELQDDNEQLQKKLEKIQLDASKKATEKAREMEEMFKKVEELEEENYTLKGQLLEKEETPLQAITVSQVHAAPQPSKVNDEQLEEIMEENKRLMDEITKMQEAYDEARRNEAELNERCRTIEEGHEHLQDSLENLRSLLLIVRTRPIVKSDELLSSDLEKAAVALSAICEANEDDPGRKALEEFLADFSHLQEEAGEKDVEISRLRDELEEVRQRNAMLQNNVSELREAVDQIHEHGNKQIDDAIIAAQSMETAQLKEELLHLKTEYQASNNELKLAKEENDQLRKQLQITVDQQQSSKSLEMKIDDLERILKQQDKVVEQLKKEIAEKEKDCRKYDDDLEQLQLKNVSLLETISELDEKLQSRPHDSPDIGHKDLLDDLAKLRNELAEKEKEQKNFIIKEEKIKDELEKKNSKLLKENNELLEELNKLKKEKDAYKDNEKEIRLLEKRVDKLEKERDDLERENEQLRNDLDQVAQVFELRQQSPPTSSANSSWLDGVPLTEYAAVIRQKLQELKTSSFAEAERLREDNIKLKSQLDHFQTISDHITRTAAKGDETDEDKELVVIPQTITQLHREIPSDNDDQLKKESVENKAEIVILKHKLNDLEQKQKKNVEIVADLERKNKELTNRLYKQQQQDHIDEATEKRNKDLEKEVAGLTKRLKQLQEQNERLAGDLVDGRLNHNSIDLPDDRQLSEDNRTLRKKVRALEDRLAEAEGEGMRITDNNNNSEVGKLRKQLEESEKQHREVVNTYRTHLLAAVQGTMDPMVQEALRQIIRIKASRPASQDGSFRSRSEASPTTHI